MKRFIMFAVFKTGGKQYRVAANDKLQIERLKGEAGDQISFTDVLMISSDNSVEIGAPLVAGATVVAEIEKHDRGPRIIIFKKRRRKHYRRRNGHRQDLTNVIITEILLGGAKPAEKNKAAHHKDHSHQAHLANKAAAEKAAAEKSGAEGSVSGQPASASGFEDDISLIGGIGPKIHKALNEQGITSLTQIANWTEQDITTIETALKIKGRVAREEWVEQANELVAGKPPRAKTDKARSKDQE